MSIFNIRNFKKCLAGVGMLVAVLFCLLATAPGHQLLIRSAHFWVTDLSINLEKGRLLSGAPFDIDYKSDHLALQAQQLAISLEWFTCSTLCLDISAQTLELAIDNQRSPQTHQALGNIENEPEEGGLEAPFNIGIKTLLINHGNLILPQQQVAIKQLNMAVYWQGTDVQIPHLTMQNVDIVQKVNEDTSPPTMPTELPVIDVTIPPLPLTLRLDRLQVSQLAFLQEGKTTQVTDIELQAIVAQAGLQWKGLRARYQQASLNAYGSLDWAKTLHVNASSELSTGTEHLTLEVSGTLSDLIIHASNQGTYASDIQAQIDFTQINWPFELSMSAMNWTLHDLIDEPLAQLSLNKASLQATGNANDYALNIKLDGTTRNNKAFDINAKVAGGLTQVQLNEGRLQWDQTDSTLQASLDWQNTLIGEVKADIAPLPLSEFISDLPNSQLAAQLDTRFELKNENWQLQVDGLAIKGSLYNRPFYANVNLTLDQDFHGQLNTLKVRYGDSLLGLEGKLHQHLALTGMMEIHHQKDPLFAADLDLSSTFEITGSHRSPKVQLQGQLTRFINEQLSVASAKFDVSTDSEINWQTNAAIQAQMVRTQGLTLDAANFGLQGDLAKHRFELNTQGDVNASISAIGGLLNSQWLGKINAATASYKNQNLVLQNAGDLQLSSEHVTLAQQCWQVSHSEMCFAAEHDLLTSKGSSQVTIKQLVLNDLNAWFEDVLQLDGLAHGDVALAWHDGKLSQADGQLKMQQVKVYTHSDEQLHTLPIEALSTQLNSNNQHAQVQWQMNSSILGRMDGQFQLPLVDDKSLSPTANLNIVHMSLSPLAPILSKSFKQPVKLDGDVSGKLSLWGSREQPQLSGNIHVDDIHLASELSPISLQNSSLIMTLNDKAASLHGVLQAQQGGKLSLDGSVNWQSGLSARIDAQGDDFFIAPKAGVELTLSPDLHFEFRQNKAALTGQVTVPYGRIEVEELPANVVQISEDQIIVDEPVTRQTHSPVPYSIDIDVQVGDDFRIKTFGLDSYITGQLDISKYPASPLLASGELLLQEGRYRAFGQDLLIKTGQIGFNGALDKPYLNVRAIRNPEVTADGVEAGIELSGSIDAPKFAIYSVPVMDQSQSLAYLLNGEPLGEGESSNDAILTQLLLSKGLGRSEGLVSKTGEKFGFKDVTLGARGSGDATKVEVSGYLTPSVQVSYRVGVFEPLNEIAVRYRVFSKLYIEATSGLYDSIDLLYKFDWDPEKQ